MSPSLSFLNCLLRAWNRLAKNHTCELKDKEIITKRDGIKLMLQQELSIVFGHL